MCIAAKWLNCVNLQLADIIANYAKIYKLSTEVIYIIIVMKSKSIDNNISFES